MSNIILKRLILLLSLFFSIIYLINGTSYVFHWIDTGGVFYSLVSTQMISYIIFATLLLLSLIHISEPTRRRGISFAVVWV